ncbi:MAG: hypothetical protein RR952_06640 [Cetobacterium sp.]
MKKLTKMNKFEMVMEILGNVEVENKDLLVEFVQHEMDLLARKNSTTGDRKPSKVQVENEKLIAKIEELQADGIARTIAEIQELSGELAELKNQKMSALLKKLVDSEIMTRFVEKKKTYFQLKSE